MMMHHNPVLHPHQSNGHIPMPRTYRLVPLEQGPEQSYRLLMLLVALSSVFTVCALVGVFVVVRALVRLLAGG